MMIMIMSRDRWNVWEINDEYELVKYEPAEVEEIDEEIKITWGGGRTDTDSGRELFVCVSTISKY